MNFTKSEIRGAILRAAQSISDDGETWDYGNSRVGHCGTPMCAAGWIGHHLGFSADTHVNAVCAVFSTGVSSVPYVNFDDHMWAIDRKWFWEPVNAVAALRAYADKYFPAEQLQPAYLKFRASLTNELVS